MLFIYRHHLAHLLFFVFLVLFLYFADLRRYFLKYGLVLGAFIKNRKQNKAYENRNKNNGNAEIGHHKVVDEYQ